MTWTQTKRPEDWKALEPDYTIVTTKLVESLKTLGISKADLHKQVSWRYACGKYR